MTIKFIVKTVESCIDCEYSDSNCDMGTFTCLKYNLDLTEDFDKFHPDCGLLSLDQQF